MPPGTASRPGPAYAHPRVIRSLEELSRPCAEDQTSSRNLCVYEFPVARCYLYNMGMSDDPVEIIAWLELGACSQPSYTRD
jgi:hypothetical protein